MQRRRRPRSQGGCRSRASSRRKSSGASKWKRESMLLALRRIFGWDVAASEEADERNWRRHKWVIEPTRMGFFARVEEVWRYRRILVFFAGQRVKDRYEGMTLGPFWLFARPLMPIFIST